MPKLICNGQVVADDWIRVQDMDIANLPDGKLLLPLALWNQVGPQWQAEGREVGLWLSSEQLPSEIAGDIPSIPVIGVEFPVFTDGRGFSIGRLLRDRYGFRNELRAVGAPIRDQLTYLCRCGFNAFELAEHYDLEAALKSLRDFRETYQVAVDQPLPKFRRYAEGA